MDDQTYPVVRFIFLLVVGIGLAYLLLVIWAFGVGMYFVSVPKPDIQYGEFPFRLTYEVDGEIKVIEDTIICEFDGFRVSGAAGKYRKWIIYLASEKDSDAAQERSITIPLLDLHTAEVFGNYEEQILEVYFYGGNAEHYMGDRDGRSAQDFEHISFTSRTKEGRMVSSFYDQEEAWDKFKIRLISWEVAPPIQNAFGDERQYWLQEGTGA